MVILSHTWAFKSIYKKASFIHFWAINWRAQPPFLLTVFKHFDVVADIDRSCPRDLLGQGKNRWFNIPPDAQI
jgi:hypothetical protein